MLFATLTLAGAVQFALSHSPTIAKQTAVVSQMESAYVRARSQTLPGVVGQLQNQMSKSANYTGQYSVIGASQAAVFSQNTASLGTSYLFNGGLSHYLSVAARQQYEQAQADLRGAEQQLTDNVASGYFALASKNEAVRLDEGDLRYQQTLVNVAKAKEHAGVAAGVDVLSAQAAEEKSRYALASAQADAQNAAESLAQIIGAPLDTGFDVPAQIAQPHLPSQPIEALIALAQEHRPDVASARDAVAIAQTNRRSADTDLYPQIQLSAGIGNQFSPTQAVMESHFGPVARGSAGYWNINALSTISLPLLDWGARRANHRNLNEQIAAAQANLGAARTQAEIEVRQSYRGAQTALTQLSSAQDETRYASEAARVAQLQYEHGLITLVDVQQRQQNALSAQV
ncbi:MAG TPA: TolC family protein, partial [Candidatus Baltobacteraceae bacterium]|nr:TolC family protein [Candidatus Baltobacteraceae bacterium]